MAIKLRRGLDVERQTILFDQGEIVYCTDTKKVWIGDGLTTGGNLVTGDELLSGLDDVSLTTLSDENVLMYNQATSKWKNYVFADKVKSVLLTGVSFATNAAITATDTILIALGKIQAQINTKENTITGAATTITTSNLTASRAIISNASGKVAVSATTDTELGYVSGVTSAIQTQINGKENTIVAGTTAQYYRGDKTFQTLDKTAVGLGNVANVDTTNANNISSGTLNDARLSANVTTQGNTFNTANKLVQLDASAKLPAVDGSNLTNLNIPPSTGGDLYLFYNY